MTLPSTACVIASTADGSTIRGLLINNFAGHGINILAGSDGHTIAGNYLGALLHDGTAAGAANVNTLAGIQVLGANNTIGGTTAADRNVISGNTGQGVLLSGAGASGNVIVGNIIGLNAAGTAIVGNGNDGVFIVDNATNNTVGGATTAHRNVISGNSDGVQFGGAAGGATGNVVRGNYIGTDITGTVDLGNNDDGIDIDNGASNGQVIDNLIAGNTSDGIDLGDAGTTNGTVIRGNLIGTAANGMSALGNSGHGILVGNGGTVASTTIGGTTTGQGNTIAFNGGDGIYVAANSTVTMLGNAIHTNTGLAIDLGTNGVTGNDLDDIDLGANGLQNFPLLTSATTTASGTMIVGSLNSTASVTTYRIEFFANRAGAADASGNGEAERYLGFITVTTDAGGDVSFNATLSNAWVNNGDRVSATATVDSGGVYGATSEMAANAIAATTGVVVVDTTSDAADGTTTSLTNLAAARGADGRISLREAIFATNATANVNASTPDRIVFAIDGAARARSRSARARCRASRRR